MWRRLRQSKEIVNLSPFTGVYICNTIKLMQTHTDFDLPLFFPVMSSDILGNAAG